jgi:beta-phosphoglucomutase-like phosphatase (HAD superfamily)
MKKNEIVYLFDVDGLIAETPHEQAWYKAAIEWNIISPKFDFTHFYAEKIAGEPGVTGAKNILSYLRENNGLTYFERENINDSDLMKQKASEFRSPVKQKYLEDMIEQGEFKVFYDIAKIILKSKLDSIPIAVVSSSENAKGILKKVKISELSKKVGVPYPTGNVSMNYLDIFETNALGAISYWNGFHIEKANHYAMAYGKLIQKINPEESPYVVVFEDAPKGIAAVSNLGFYSVGISRKSKTGRDLASKKELQEAGASIVLDEQELSEISYEQLKAQIFQLFPENNPVNVF